MTMSDPIADMLTRIRNANTAKHDTVDVPASKMKTAIADIKIERDILFNRFISFSQYGSNTAKFLLFIFFSPHFPFDYLPTLPDGNAHSLKPCL